jgi:hypothetical protein
MFACYRAGTRVSTGKGEVAVESLAIGDLVITVSGEVKPVKWIGYRRVDCSRHPDPGLVWPVRVRAGAFGDRLPHSDLWLSPDHAVFVDDVLIPIKHLINGAAIAQVPMREVTYYHVELPRHDVLIAEGLPAESYLDTGNRCTFANGGGAVTLHPVFDAPRVGRDVIAPLAVDEARVRPVWERLATRSRAIGQPIPHVAFTGDPAVVLRMDGRVIRPLVAEPHRFTFALPMHGGPVHFVSRSGYPTDARPWVGDRRRLGVCVRRVVWYDREGSHDMPIDHPGLGEGWWDVEYVGQGLQRWTDGDALLPMSPNAIAVEVHLAGCLTYRLDSSESESARDIVERAARAA